MGGDGIPFILVSATAQKRMSWVKLILFLMLTRLQHLSELRNLLFTENVLKGISPISKKEGSFTSIKGNLLNGLKVAKEKLLKISMPASIPLWESEGFESIAGIDINFPIDGYKNLDQASPRVPQIDTKKRNLLHKVR